MKLLEWIRSWLKPKPKMKEEPRPAALEKLRKTCKSCGKTFTVDPSWEHIPNYCKDCKKKFVAEKEAKQRSGAPRKIKRTCKECGRVFTFPNTLAHYPNYCGNCRKAHQVKMKEKYARRKADA